MGPRHEAGFFLHLVKCDFADLTSLRALHDDILLRWHSTANAPLQLVSGDLASWRLVAFRPLRPGIISIVADDGWPRWCLRVFFEPVYDLGRRCDVAKIRGFVFLLLMTAITIVAGAQSAPLCKDLPDHSALSAALKNVVAVGDQKANGGLALNMWATLVARDGTVCAVTFSGAGWGDQWLGSRVISAQKANTANAFSLNGLAISTANLYSAVQPGGSLFGLQLSNPVDPAVAYAGSAAAFGKANDPMTGKRIGGVNVFGGGLALYDKAGKMIGAVGLSGDTACADHNIAWKLRHALNLDNVPAGLNNKSSNPKGDDNIIFDIADGKSAGGFGHPDCGLGEKAIAEEFSKSAPVGPEP